MTGIAREALGGLFIRESTVVTLDTVLEEAPGIAVCEYAANTLLLRVEHGVS